MSHFSSDERALDPEFTALQDAFALDEVPSASTLEPRTRQLAVLAALLGCQGVDEFEAVLPHALDDGVTPVEAKEVVYQAAAYLGIGRVRPFLAATNRVLQARDVELPLEAQGTVTAEGRRQKGSDAQVELFGKQMADAWKAGDINRFLASNCFGDYYTRKGLDLTERELVTFCYLVAQGGCEPQATAHAMANFRRGTGKEELSGVVVQLVPYLGYPRTLNALNVIKQADEQYQS